MSHEKHPYYELVPLVAKVLRDEWDPIGVADVAPDEYDSYVPKVLGLLLDGADVAALADHLYRLETVRMGLKGDLARDRIVAERLRSLVDAQNPREPDE